MQWLPISMRLQAHFLEWNPSQAGRFLSFWFLCYLFQCLKLLFIPILVQILFQALQTRLFYESIVPSDISSSINEVQIQVSIHLLLQVLSQVIKQISKTSPVPSIDPGIAPDVSSLPKCTPESPRLLLLLDSNPSKQIQIRYCLQDYYQYCYQEGPFTSQEKIQVFPSSVHPLIQVLFSSISFTFQDLLITFLLQVLNCVQHQLFLQVLVQVLVK